MARVVLVPGFTQTAAAWNAVARALQIAGHEPIALDVPAGLDFVATAAALGTQGGPAVYVGYSMGGRLCLRLAVDRPEIVEQLALVSASPGIADADERAARRASDEALARDVEARGVEPFLEDWVAQPLFATLPTDPADLAARAAGHTVASLTSALRALGTGTQEPLWDRLGSLRMRVALITGRSDTKFDQINDEMHAACTAASLTRVRLAGGHALPLEQPDALAQCLAEWLAH